MRTSLIGGDTAHRGLFGGTVSKPRLIVLGLAALVGLVCTWIWSLWGLIGLVGLPLVAWAVTVQTDNDTILARRLVRIRRNRQRRDGTLAFVPYDPDGWRTLTDAWAGANGRAARKAALRDLHAMRAVPDGVEGMLWLQDGYRIPGIQWHQPTHGEEYLAVAFSTTGQVEGIEDDPVFDAATTGFESVLAGIGEELSLASRIQTITRVLPSDPAAHEAWIAKNGDPKTRRLLHNSYRQVVDAISAAQLVQRPMFVVVWPVSDRFVDRAERRGPGIDGWLDLMASEIRAITVRLAGAGFKDVHALTARRTAAVLRHLQHPGFPIDQAGDIGPDHAWLPSEDDWSYTTYVGAPGGEVSQSLSRTARISAKHMQLTHRTALWMAPMLGEMTAQVVRTISFHLELTPQDSARFLAEKDRVSDIADKNRRSRAGILDDAELNVEEQAALRRIEDLTPGTGHVGANWVGYVTVTAGTRRELQDACEHMNAAAAQAGIDKLDWLDPFHQAANAYTWPVGRGIRPARASATTRVEQLAAGREAKESL